MSSIIFYRSFSNINFSRKTAILEGDKLFWGGLEQKTENWEDLLENIEICMGKS